MSNKIVEILDRMPHCVLLDGKTGDAHVFPMGLIMNIANGKMELNHISDVERDAIIRCLARGVADMFGEL